MRHVRGIRMTRACPMTTVDSDLAQHNTLLLNLANTRASIP